jgi:5-methylcytosine-specific restriction endonuclease McrA
MPKYFCFDCGKVSDQRKCEIHRNIIKKRTSRSISYRQRKYRKDAVNRHIAMNGYICFGYKRRPHFATDLTADHPIPTSKGGNEYQQLEVFCRSCNSSKQASMN